MALILEFSNIEMFSTLFSCVDSVCLIYLVLIIQIESTNSQTHDAQMFAAQMQC